jgi:GNAT superfamily N-acetyltransferase
VTEPLTTHQIVAAGPGDPAVAAIAAEIIADAFQHLAVSAWLVPDADAGAVRAVLELDMAIWTEYALLHGMVDLTGDRSAVAVWFPAGGDPLPEPVDYDARLAAATGRYLARFRALDTAFEANHPHGEKHHHLAFLAVRPGYQGRGIGSALLRHHHARYPTVPAYLEASSRRSRALYLRHGYVGRGEFTLPDGPPMWPCWRPALATAG